MRKNFYKIFVLLFAMGLLITACDNVDVKDTQLDEQSTNDATFTSAAITDAFTVVNSNLSTSKAVGTCGVAVYDVATTTLTITYPEGGCTEDNGITKSGVITAVLSGAWGVGATMTITFDGYTVNDKTLDGTIAVSYAGLAPYPTFDLTATNMSLTFQDGSSVTWTSEKTFTWIDGYATLGDKTDDEWQIDGSANGITRSSKNFTRVETKLLTSPTCKWFIDGTIDLTVGESDTYSMAFGPSCGAVTFTYKGITIQRTFD